MLYTARLENLPAGAKLEYRLIGNGQVGKWHNLSTDDGGAFTALIFPDSQSSDYSGWQELAQNAAKKNPEAKFFVNMGDLVDNGEDHSQWEAWFNSLAGIIDRIPVGRSAATAVSLRACWPSPILIPMSRRLLA